MRSLHFVRVARQLALAARAADLEVPAFRSPPHDATARRTIKRLPGGPVVAVRVQGRDPTEVEHDMVEGVIVANRLQGEAATRLRATLRRALERSGAAAA